MNKYELVVIVKAQMPQEAKEAIAKYACDAISKNGGKVINSQVWLEKHKLAFSIKKCLEATFYLIKFDAPTAAIIKAKQLLRMNEEILRFMFTKI
ncbi:MAG: 30S ribosomal protein S6 [Candidatus Omnitrophota bacterium]